MSIYTPPVICNNCGGMNGFHAGSCPRRPKTPYKPPERRIIPPAQPREVIQMNHHVTISKDGFIVFDPNKPQHMAEVFAMLPEKYQ